MPEDTGIGEAAAAVGSKFQNAAGQMPDTLSSVAQTGREWGRNVADMAKDKPLTAVLVALSLGFVVRVLTHAGHR